MACDGEVWCTSRGLRAPFYRRVRVGEGEARPGHGSSSKGSRAAVSPAGRALRGGQQRCPAMWPPSAGRLAGQEDCGVGGRDCKG
jgi:hypothetical protein